MSSTSRIIPFLLVAGLAFADRGVSGQEHVHGSDMPIPSMPEGYSLTREHYAPPDVTLEDHEGRPVSLRTELDSKDPIALNFIFTTCSTICPVMTATFAKMRDDLGSEADQLRIISISIDPEYDTPAVLKRYAERYRAFGNWRFLTGEVEEIVSVLEAFDAYAGSKLNHHPLTFFKAPSSEEWVRIEGLASGADLAKEYRRLVESK